MAVALTSPAGLLQPAPYHHVSVATGSRHVHIAGQTASDGEGNLIASGDLAGQVAQSPGTEHRKILLSPCRIPYAQCLSS